ncbi:MULTISPECIES: Mov34/MPN/PAD-1 family protein [Acetobacter]|nr:MULTISPECIES: Mov34/MPN/PAD-1 family protein [Acetobacter]NHN93074.1 hypothetical protein [Acetobacter sicerae]
MRLLLSPNVAQRLAKVLRQRGSTETGGILMGEHVAHDEFRIVNFSVQRSKGTFASFLRMPRLHLRQLERFFKQTEHDYMKYNYLGEWHSHPSFGVTPSFPDLHAMHTLVDDASTGATFAILMIVRLDQDTTLNAGTYLFMPGDAGHHPVPLMLEAEDVTPPATDRGMIARFFQASEHKGAVIRLISNPEIRATIDAD